MFEFKFTVRDLVRAVWAFGFGFVGFYALNAADILKADDPVALGAALITGAVIAGFSAVKNLALKDGTTLKG